MPYRYKTLAYNLIFIMNTYPTLYFSMDNRRTVTLCNHNYSENGILHPDRIMTEYDFLFMQNGHWDIYEEDSLFHLQPGNLLILEPGKHHYSQKKCSPKMRNIYIHVKAEKNDFSLSSSEDKIDANALNTGNYIQIPKLSDLSNNHEMLHNMEKIIGCFWSKNDPIKDYRCSIYLEDFLLRLSDHYNILHGNTDVLISEILHRFDCETHRFLSPEDLARDYNISVRSLSGRFKKWTGMSIHQYQIKLKLDMAYNILPISQGRSLHDIALSFGFYDEFQFSKLFKREFGISPSKRR